MVVSEKKRVRHERETIAQAKADMKISATMEPLEMKLALELGTGLTGYKCTSEPDMKAHPTVVEMDSKVVYELGA